MNWKEHAHLFANGKFKVQTRGGYECEIKAFFIRDNLLQITFGDTTTVDEPKYLKLIARPIEDMTDEEVKESPNCGGLHEAKWYKDWWIRYSKDIRNMPTDDFLYLLSIGVYPFSDTEDVIFKPR